ncbi:MAG: type II secretion system protein GspE, partial [Eubacteriales bacterium]|nr:type II secretion system protein GspE [Eubacteriales bacterium]
PANPAEKEVFRKRGMEIEELTVGKGCNACRQTGYRGRMAIHELIVITDEIKNMLMENVTMSQLAEHLREQGVRVLVDDGLEKVRQGKTTIDEVLRVASLD